MRNRKPYRRFVIASLLRGQSESHIKTCLRSFGLCSNLDLAVFPVTQTNDFDKDVAAYPNLDINGRLDLAKKYDVYTFIINAENKWPSWIDFWDLASVGQYRDFIFVLGSLSSADTKTIADALNRKFSREFGKAAIDLLLDNFWSLKGLTTIEISNAIKELSSKSLAKSINKLLYGDAIAAAKSVGASLKLNYALILEEMLFEAYAEYRQRIDNKATASELRDTVNNILKIGDRFDKISKKSADADVLHDLLQTLKLESDDDYSHLDDFLKDNKVM